MFLELIEVIAYKEYSDKSLEDLCPNHTIVEKRMASEKSLSDSLISYPDVSGRFPGGA